MDTKTKNINFNSLSIVYWLLFGCCLGLMVFNLPEIPVFENEWIRFNSFSALIWLVVTFFSAIIGTYSKNFLKGFEYQQSFNLFAFLFTISVMVLVVANHIGLLILAWLGMGFCMSRLIGVNRKWGEAVEASRYTFRNFALGGFFLSLGLGILAYGTDSSSLSGILSGLQSLSIWILLPASILIITASLVQSAIYPFHRWLLSAMTAPTPASALMHAGFVNAAGILLAMLAGVIFYSNTYDILFIIGGLTAIIAQFTKLIQVRVKHKLACSTIAQMGFMIMQCGLGFFNAAIAHLILHGFYKAYLFLSSGEEIRQSNPGEPPRIRINAFQAILVMLFSLLGAWMFMVLTGKAFAADSSIFLSLIVAITVGQVTYNIVKERSMSYPRRILVSILLFVSGTLMYSLAFNGVSFLMKDMPLTQVVLELRPTQVIFGIIFLLGFFLMKLGVYRRIPGLYVLLLNNSQPFSNTLLKYKSKGL